MTYDPFQTNATLGAYSGIGNPFQTPYTALQTSAYQPFAAWGNPQQFGAGQFGVNPWNPYNGGPNPVGVGQNPYSQNPQLQNPLLQNQLTQNGFQQNPLQQIVAQQLAQQAMAQQIAQHIAHHAALQAQQLAMLAQQNWAYGQPGSIGYTQGIPQGGPQGILGQSPFAQLAPQSWVGQGGQGIPGAGLLNPLTARGLQGF